METRIIDYSLWGWNEAMEQQLICTISGTQEEMIRVARAYARDYQLIDCEYPSLYGRKARDGVIFQRRLLNKWNKPTDHEQRKNHAGRQVCCKVCHVCGAGLTEVLDGELWCPYCERYR